MDWLRQGGMQACCCLINRFKMTDVAAQNLSIVVGDHEGNLVGCLPHCTQWKLRLNDMIMSNMVGIRLVYQSILHQLRHRVVPLIEYYDC